MGSGPGWTCHNVNGECTEATTKIGVSCDLFDRQDDPALNETRDKLVVPIIQKELDYLDRSEFNPELTWQNISFSLVCQGIVSYPNGTAFVVPDWKKCSISPAHN